MEASDSHGSSALVWASRAGHTKVIKLLINIWKQLDTFAIIWKHLDVYFGHVKVVELLLKHKAAPDALGMYRLSALALATMHGHHDTISTLLRC